MIEQGFQVGDQRHIGSNHKSSQQLVRKKSGASTFYPGGTLKLINNENELLQDLDLINANEEEELEDDSESRRATRMQQNSVSVNHMTQIFLPDDTPIESILQGKATPDLIKGS